MMPPDPCLHLERGCFILGGSKLLYFCSKQHINDSAVRLGNLQVFVSAELKFHTKGTGAFHAKHH